MTTDLNTELYGLGIYQAKRKIELLGLKIGEIQYSESPIRRLTVLKARQRKSKNSSVPVVDLQLSGINPIKHLPSIYQNNDFLNKFLWVFQHLSYEITAVLDNLHLFLTPMEAPSDFVEWIATWFGLNIENLGDENSARLLLQNAVLLYRWRGTSKGLRAILKIVTGVEPEIFENSMPYGPYVISGGAVEGHVLNKLTANSYFTVYFPVEEHQFTPHIRARIVQIMKTEKPAHTQSYITYKIAEKAVRKSTVILDDTMLGGGDGMSI